MAVQWFLRGKDKVHGPFDAAKLRAFATAGKISRNTDISQSAEGPWHKAGRVQGLFATAAIDGGVQPPAQSVPPPLQRDTGLSERRPIKSPPMSKVMPPSSSLPQNIQLNSIDPTELAFNATKKPLSQQKQKKTRGGKIGGGIGGFIGVCVILYNVFVVVNNGYLHTDAAAIGLLKTSMQETLTKDESVAKPVEVIKVQLDGKGHDRTGKVVIKFAGQARTVAFTATVNKNGSNGVTWEMSEPLPGPRHPSVDDPPQRVAQPRSLPPAESRLAATQNLTFNEQDWQKHFQNLITNSAAIDTSEALLFRSDPQLDDARVNNELDKLHGSWKRAVSEASWLRAALQQVAQTKTLDDKEIEFENYLRSLCTVYPAVNAAIEGARVTTDNDEYVAHMQTYLNLSSKAK